MISALVYVDFEATGLRPSQAHIIQVGAVCEIGERRYTFEELSCPTVHVSDRICEITGLKRLDINRARGVREVLETFVAFLTSLPASSIILVAYNGQRYDFPLFYWNCVKYGLKYEDIVQKCNIIYLGDPLLWLRTTLKTERMVRTRSGRPSYKLGDVYECMYQRRFEDAHTALADATALLEITSDPQHVREGFMICPSAYLIPALSLVEGFTTQLQSKEKKSRTVSKVTMMREPSEVLRFLRGYSSNVRSDACHRD